MKEKVRWREKKNTKFILSLLLFDHVEKRGENKNHDTHVMFFYFLVCIQLVMFHINFKKKKDFV